MKAIVLAVALLMSVVACATDTETASITQKICVIEDVQNGTCPSVRDSTNAVLDSLVQQYGTPTSRQVDCRNTDACSGAVMWWELLGTVECWQLDSEIICYTVVQ